MGEGYPSVIACIIAKKHGHQCVFSRGMWAWARVQNKSYLLPLSILNIFLIFLLLKFFFSEKFDGKHFLLEPLGHAKG